MKTIKTKKRFINNLWVNKLTGILTAVTGIAAVANNTGLAIGIFAASAIFTLFVGFTRIVLNDMSIKDK